MKFYQNSGFTRKRKNNIDVKCYRCEQIGHFRKQCNSNTKKQKSVKNIARDESRLQDFIRMKTVSKFHFGLRLEVHNLNEVIDFLDKTDLDAINKIIGLKKENADLKEELSTVKVVKIFKSGIIYDITWGFMVLLYLIIYFIYGIKETRHIYIMFSI